MSRTYDHGNPRSLSPMVGEDQPHRGSGPVYIDPYDSIPDVQSQYPHASSETRYGTQNGTRSIRAQQGYGIDPPYHPSQNSGYGFAPSSSRHTTPAYHPQPVHIGVHVRTTRYTNSGATHSLPHHPTTIDATRIPPPSAKMLSYYYFRFYFHNERDAVYSLNAHLEPNQNYQKTSFLPEQTDPVQVQARGTIKRLTGVRNIMREGQDKDIGIN